MQGYRPSPGSGRHQAVLASASGLEGRKGQLSPLPVRLLCSGAPSHCHAAPRPPRGFSGSENGIHGDSASTSSPPKTACQLAQAIRGNTHTGPGSEGQEPVPLLVNPANPQGHLGKFYN